MNKEIERKYAIAYLPDDIRIEKVSKIEQIYIYHDGNTMVRIRKVELQLKDKEPQIEYIYTVKTKGDIAYNNQYQIGQKYEIESKITKEEYERLRLKKLGNTITKTRVVVPIQNKLKAEIDIYYDYLQGFLTAEVEFSNEEQAKKFMKPDWLGEEIGYKELSNRRLSQMTEEQFKSKVSIEFMEHNKVIIKKLNQLIKLAVRE